MSGSCFRRESCRLCGGGELDVVLPMAATPPGDHYVSASERGQKQEVYPLDVALCGSCGLAQLAYTVDPNILYGLYVYTTSISLGLVDHFRRYGDSVLAKVKPATGAFVVDVGSNDGSLLRCFQERGLRVLGVDPATDIARLATESGVETIPGYFTTELAGKIRSERGAAAIITANNVFANVDDVTDWVGGIRHLLAPDGVFVFETSYFGDVIEKLLVETITHEHLSFFSVKPLETFFRKCGMQLIDVERVPTKGGSIRGMAQLAGGPRPVAASVAALITLETRMGLHQPGTFREYGDRLDSVKKNLHALLDDLHNKGKKVAGYGASVGVTTLLYRFALGERFPYLVDDNPRKQNTFSPGHHIPVLPSQALYERKPDCVLILAWAYAEPIMKKHQKFRDQGGTFMVPLPEPRIL